VLLLGAACCAIGVALTADPSWSLSVVDWLVAAALIATPF